MHTLLFLLPLSCMVVPIGKFVNKFSFSTHFNTSNTDSNLNTTSLPPMSIRNDLGIDFQRGVSPAINSEVRGRNPSPSAKSSRESSLASSGRSTPYHERMEIDVVTRTDESNTESLDLSYETAQEKAIRVSMVANQQVNQQAPMRPLGGINEATPTHGQHEEDVINVQIPYDFNAPTKPKLWSGSFHPISLHGSVEHFASDSKNIKVTLNFLAKYIQNKQVNGNAANDLSDFNGMGDAIWNFILLIYDVKWDALHTDNKSNTLRAKISSKFTPRIPTQAPNGNNKKEMPKSSPVTINKAPPLPSLPAKSKKEINMISKYFQPKKNSVEPSNLSSKSNAGKSYVQASKSSFNTSEVLKIKETFPSLNAKKIKQVNSIINGQNKTKPRIKMTTKGPSRKQIIIPMSNDNVVSFMKNSFSHVANINRSLRNAKTDILVDYIRSDNTGISVVVDKIAQQSDIAIINNYVKNSTDINSLQVEDACFPMSKSYLKIIGIPYYPYLDNRQTKLSSDDIQNILKQNHIFDNISLVSKPRVIKVSLKSDMALVWINI